MVAAPETQAVRANWQLASLTTHPTLTHSTRESKRSQSGELWSRGVRWQDALTDNPRDLTQWNRGNFPKDKSSIFSQEKGCGYHTEINKYLIQTILDLHRTSLSFTLPITRWCRQGSQGRDHQLPFLERHCSVVLHHLRPRIRSAWLSRSGHPVLCGREVTIIQEHPHWAQMIAHSNLTSVWLSCCY